MNGLSSLQPLGSDTFAGGFGSSRMLAGGNSLDEQRAFQEVLGIARASDPNASVEDRERDAVEAAEKLVASVFIEPLLKSVRESSQAAPPFAPTKAEKQFRGLMDARVAESVVHRSNMPIVQRIAADLIRAGGSS